MFPLSLLQYGKLAAGTLVLLCVFYFGWHLRDNDFMAYKTAQQAATQKIEKEYQQKADQIEKDKNAQIRNINAQLVDAISELRKRPSRASEASNGQSCNGTGLYAEDAEFLVREAARADQIRVALQACYQQYDSIK